MFLRIYINRKGCIPTLSHTAAAAAVVATGCRFLAVRSFAFSRAGGEQH